MPHYTDKQIEDADQTDLASYLISRGESLKRCGQQVLWEKHQVWISGNRWYTHYDSVGGYAVRFVMRYFNLDFPHAVADLLGDHGNIIAEEPLKADTLALPKPNQTMNQVFAYLIEKRFIARDVVHYFAHKGTLYEDAQYHNCIFVGLDEEGVPRHVHRRSTRDSFKQTLAGSQAEYSFHHDGPGEWLFVFEAPIDMLAFITRHPKNWAEQSYVALCSVSEKALLHRLEVNPRLRKIVLCLDNDNAGVAASERIKTLLNSKGYSDVRILKPVNKDWDEDCKADNGIVPIPAEANHAEQIILKCRDLFEKIEQTPRPTMLYEKLKDSFQALVNRPSRSQVERFLIYLIWQVREEYRKSKSPVEWNRLFESLCSCYVPCSDNGDEDYRMKQILGHGQSYFGLYDNVRLISDAEYFTVPAQELCMDCIRYLCYMERKVPS